MCKSFSVKDINGSIVNSYTVCKKKTWLTARRIQPNKTNMYLQMGNVYTESRGSNKRFGNIEVDEISKGKHIIVKEYKKTFSNIEASKMQLLFYMYNIQKELNLKKVEGYVISEETDEKIYLLLDKKK